MKKKFVLQCEACGAKYPYGTYHCEHNDGVLFAIYDYQQKKSINELENNNEKGIWAFKEVLPEVDEYFSFTEGNTPCIKSRLLGPELGITLYIKDEGRNPTGSFKDRAATLLVSTERDLGNCSGTTGSSGNAAGALSLYSQLASMKLYVFMYEPTANKLLHTASFGARIFLVEATRESEVHRLADEASNLFGWSCLTTMSSANPFNIEGYKTISYEIVRDINCPDYVVVPVGSGTLALGIWKGFYEIKQMGLISKMPRLVGVQPEKVQPIVTAYKQGKTEINAVAPGKTAATGVVVDNPGVAGKAILKAVKKTEGFFISISESEISSAFTRLPREEGIFAEPSGAVSTAGLIKARRQNLIPQNKKVVCINSASGFKDIKAFNSISELKSQIMKINPDINSIKKILNKN